MGNKGKQGDTCDAAVTVLVMAVTQERRKWVEWRNLEYICFGEGLFSQGWPQLLGQTCWASFSLAVNREECKLIHSVGTVSIYSS